MDNYTGPPLPAGALDEMLDRLLREAADYERRIRKAQQSGEPEHHLPNLRRAWYGQVLFVVRQWIEEHRGRGRSRRVRELEARIANDPRWTQLITRDTMSTNIRHLTERDYTGSAREFISDHYCPGRRYFVDEEGWLTWENEEGEIRPLKNCMSIAALALRLGELSSDHAETNRVARQMREVTK